MTADDRSIALHREVARRLLDDPAIVSAARERVQTWLATGGAHPVYAARWLEILERPPGEIAAFLTEASEIAATLRSVSPFAGVLEPRVRWRILRELR